MIITLTAYQVDALNKLWFLYGNNGPKSNLADHRFIQCLLEENRDERKFFKPSAECVKAVDEILKDGNA